MDSNKSQIHLQWSYQTRTPRSTQLLARSMPVEKTYGEIDTAQPGHGSLLQSRDPINGGCQSAGQERSHSKEIPDHHCIGVCSDEGVRLGRAQMKERG